MYPLVVVITVAYWAAACMCTYWWHWCIARPVLYIVPMGSWHTVAAKVSTSVLRRIGDSVKIHLQDLPSVGWF